MGGMWESASLWSLSVLPGARHGDRAQWEGHEVANRKVSPLKRHVVGLPHAQDYPITDVCQILQKAKELQDSK